MNKQQLKEKVEAIDDVVEDLKEQLEELDVEEANSAAEELAEQEGSGKVQETNVGTSDNVSEPKSSPNVGGESKEKTFRGYHPITGEEVYL